MEIPPLLKKLAAVFITALLFYSLSRNLFEYQGKLQYYETEKKEAEIAEKENRELKTRLRQSQDSYTVEREIRQNLGMVKNGEVLVILPNISPTLTPTPTIVKSPPQQWIEVFW